MRTSYRYVQKEPDDSRWEIDRRICCTHFQKRNPLEVLIGFQVVSAGVRGIGFAGCAQRIFLYKGYKLVIEAPCSGAVCREQNRVVPKSSDVDKKDPDITVSTIKVDTTQFRLEDAHHSDLPEAFNGAP